MTERFPFADRWLSASGLCVLVGIGGFAAWSAFAPLAEGVTASGQIVVDDNKKTVQHLEGGIIRKINVREGQLVQAGETLFEIDALAMTANRDQVAQERATFLASIDRLNALLVDQETVEFPSQVAWTVSDEQGLSIASQQTAMFQEQRLSLLATLQVLESRRASLEVGERQRLAEIEAHDEGIAALEEELALKEKMLAERLVRQDEVQRLRRDRASLGSQRAALEARRLESQAQIGEIDRERAKAKAQFREEISRELLDTRAALIGAEEKLKAIEDAVRRSAVVAPVSGQVINLGFATLGGVVQAGEPMLEIVPKASGLIGTLQIMPADREAVFPGLTVQAHLSGLKSWKTAPIAGTVVSVSGDLKRIPETGLSYYEAQILLDDSSIDRETVTLIAPGMPLEAFVDSGVRKTLIEYLIEPIYMHFARGLSQG